MSRVADTIPHSWSIEHWPEHVHPGTPTRARYLVRANRDSLLAAGAISRVGREIVILGGRYSRWLEKNTANVPGYEIAANRPAKPAYMSIDKLKRSNAKGLAGAAPELAEALQLLLNAYEQLDCGDGLVTNKARRALTKAGL